MTRDQYTQKLNQLVGNSITNVVYHELKYENEESYIFDDPSFDTLDYGLELTFDRQRVKTFTWGSEFYSYGISVIDKPMDEVVTESQWHNVNHNEKWSKVLHKNIISIKIFWGYFSETQPIGIPFKGDVETKKHYYPQDILMKFDNECIIIIFALEINEDKKCMWGTDNITVFDSLGIAKKYGFIDKNVS